MNTDTAKGKSWYYAGIVLALALCIEQFLTASSSFWRVTAAILACATFGFLILSFLGLLPRRWATGDANKRRDERRWVELLAFIVVLSALNDSKGHEVWQIIFGVLTVAAVGAFVWEWVTKQLRDPR